MRTRWLILTLLAGALPGCLWDFEFFETVREVGPEVTVADRGATDAAGDPGPADAGQPPAVSGPGPGCDAGACAFLAIERGEVAGLAPDDRGGLWVLVHGPVRAVRARGGAELTIQTAAASHLVHAEGLQLAPRVAIPLPFLATHVAAVDADVYVTGSDASGGVVGGTSLALDGRNALLLKLVADVPQWTLSWHGQRAAVAAADGAVWLLGRPGNAEIFHSGQAQPVQVGAYPGAPLNFVAKVDGAGGLIGIQPFGEAGTDIQRIASSPGGFLALAGIAPQPFGTWDGGAVPMGRYLAVLDGAQRLQWATAWPFNDAVELDAIGVDVAGGSWAAGQPASGAAELGPLPPECAEGPFLARAQPDGRFTHAAVLAVDGQRPSAGNRVVAVGAQQGEPVAALLETSAPAGAAIELGGQRLTASGLQLSALDSNARATWSLALGPARPSGAARHHAVGQDGLHFVALPVAGALAWEGEPIWDGPTGPDPRAVVLRYRP